MHARRSFARAPPSDKRASRERRSRREPEKKCHFGTLTTHFPREKRTSTHWQPATGATAPQRNCARGTYGYAAASTAKNTVLAPARHASDQRRPPAAPPATPPAVPPTAAPGRLYWAAAAARVFTESDTRAAPSPRAADAHSGCAPSTRRASTAPEPLPTRRQRTVDASRPPTPAPPPPPPPPLPDDEAIANATRMPPRSGPSGGDSPATASQPW